MNNCYASIELLHHPELRGKPLAVDDIRRRFGFYSVQRGMMYRDHTLASLNAKEDNVVHPHGYMERGNRTGAYVG